MSGIKKREKAKWFLVSIVIVLLIIILFYSGLFFILFNLVLAFIYSVWSVSAILFIVAYARSKRIEIYIDPENNGTIELPNLSILIPLYKEGKESIEKTFTSIVNQNYPKEKIEVLFILEPDDEATASVIDEVMEIAKNEKMVVKKIFSDGNLKIKARALNAGLKAARGEIIGVLDADDYFPSDFFLKTGKIFRTKSVGALGTRVYRYRKSILGKLLNIEMYQWYNIYVPIIKGLSGITLLSGEGMFVKREVLDEIGGFPERTAEDAFTAIEIHEKDHEIALTNSFVIESAPKNLKAFVKQRMRWFKGYSECLNWVSKTKLPRKNRMLLTLAMSLPSIFSLGFLPLLISFAYLLLFLTDSVLKIDLLKGIFIHPILFYWGVIISIITFLFMLGLFFRFLVDKEWRSYSYYVFLFPFYWLLLFLVALLTRISTPKKWYKTER